jgi:choline kinase
LLTTTKKRKVLTKMNIAILAAGAGQRFVDEGYSIPKPMIAFRGKPIVFWLLDGLHFTEDDHVAIVHK